MRLQIEKGSDFETAIAQVGYGRYQGILLVVCGAIYSACAIGTTTLSFVLPSAECDFRMTSADKGKLNATPLVGMVVGSYIWGNVADAIGRKRSLVAALLMDSLAALASSLSQTFPLFLFFRFFNGFGIIGALSIVFTYFSEFLAAKNRDVMLCRLEIFWTLGVILLPGIAWVVIPRPWMLGNIEGFSFSSWRMFVALCGMPSLIMTMILCFFPETPKYLMTHGKMDRALVVMETMFAFNSGLDRSDYPVRSLINPTQIQRPSYKNESAIRRLRLRLGRIWEQKKIMFSPPYLRYISLTCFADFGLMFSYYTLMLWFPELFERFQNFYQVHSDRPSASVCDVSSIVVDGGKIECPKPIDSTVFLYTLIIGLSCIPTSVSLSLLINKLEKKFLLIFSFMAAGFAALGLNVVKNSTQNLILSCIFEAVTSTTEVILFCVIVELFPTSLRALAMSLTVTSGRLGAIAGNVVFGALIDLNCIIPIYMFGTFLISSGILCIFIPKSPNKGLASPPMTP
ncbi:synaptic vesicle glycoprotein 2B [Cephus cinctus]|uniref:Synaptic vesicle glycoprotein 2B n=1 Tax=Cephus cinctus TaxID=211228 RepID=A0AAJ7RM43_CEPCN|nr:synaptic vesicle glycoprotein 2B [Cephus cinctus]